MMFKTLTSSIKLKVKPTDAEINKIQSYIFCRWLSGNPLTVQAGNMINMYPSIPMVNQYYMVKHAFAGKIKYIPYPKDVTPDTLKNVEYIAEHFKISIQKAQEYIELMDPDEFKSITQMYITRDLKK